jgi:hypothetical protein
VVPDVLPRWRGRVRPTRTAALGIVLALAVGAGLSSGSARGAAHAGVAKALNPCKLVSSRQMQSIMGMHVTKLVLAPLGPTCIYQFRGTSREVTLAVEKAKYASLTRQLKKRRRLTVAHRHAACGKLGQWELYVSLPHRKVLNVTAGCAKARRIAKIALPKLGA